MAITRKISILYRVILLFLFLINFNFLFSQLTEDAIPSLENTNLEISNIQLKIANIDYRLTQLRNENSKEISHLNNITNIENSRNILSQKLEKLERIKFSIEYAQKYNLVENKNSENIEQSTPKDKSWKKVIIRKSDFDALPESNKQAILSNPDQYEISK